MMLLLSLLLSLLLFFDVAVYCLEWLLFAKAVCSIVATKTTQAAETASMILAQGAGTKIK